MTVEFASLVAEIDSRPAVTAKENLLEFAEAAGVAESAALRLKTAATNYLDGGSAGIANRQLQQVAQSQSEVERATYGAVSISKAATTQRRLEAAAMRELVQADKEYERSVEATRRAVERLRLATDPLAAAQDRVNRELEEANRLYKLGAIDAAEYARAQAVLTNRLGAITAVHGKAASGARLQAHELGNLGAQFADVGVSLASSQALWLVAIQQGTQIGQVFADAATRGVTLKAALLGVAQTVGRFLAAVAPVAAIVGAVGGAFLLWRDYLNDAKKALEATEKSAEQFGEVQGAVRDALNSAVDFTAKYSVANDALAASLDTVLSSQSAAYRETLAGVDATDAASRAGLRRAEIERIQTVEILKRAAASATARAAEADAAAKQSQSVARRAGIMVAIGLGGMPDALSVGQNARDAKFRALGGDATAKAAAQEREYARSLTASADALMKATLVLPKETKAKTATAAATEKAAETTDEFARELEQVLQSLETFGERAAREAAEKMAVLDRAFKEGRISASVYADAIRRVNPEVILADKSQKAWNDTLQDTPGYLHDMAGRLETAEDRVRNLADAFMDAQYSLEDMLRSMKSGDIGGFLLNIQGLVNGIGTLLSQGPAGIASLGAMAANAIGGKTGRAVGGGLGLAASGLGLGAFAGSAAGAAALGTVGLGAGAIGGIAALAGPIGIAAGALYAAAKLLNVGGKPSNAGAGVDLVTGQLSGKSRTPETENAAVAAADAIKGIEDALKAAGIGLTDSVRGLVLGTRDQTQIYLQSGKTLMSAVGDSGAAVDTAMRALLDGAKFVSEAQEKLVRSAVAAGKGFDAVAEILAGYEAAQNISKGLADQILQLTDPLAYAVQQVEREIEAQAKAYKELADQGYLTAEQLAEINGQLATLKGLKLSQTASAANESISAIDSARDALLDSYNAFRSAKEGEIAALRQTADGLRAFRKELEFGAVSGRDPVSQYAALKAEFDRLAALDAKDPARVANLQSVGQALIEASRVASPTSLAFDRDIAAVRRAVEGSETAANQQADLAQAQLDAYTAQLEQLGLLNTTALGIEEALSKYLAALAGEQAAANDNLDVEKYLARNADLGANWDAGGIMRTLGATLEEAARKHYEVTGRHEIAAGQREKFATGGGFQVGGEASGDQVPVNFMANGGEYVSITRADTMASLLAETRALRQAVEGMRGDQASVPADTKTLKNKFVQVTRDGERMQVTTETEDAA